VRRPNASELYRQASDFIEASRKVRGVDSAAAERLWKQALTLKAEARRIQAIRNAAAEYQGPRTHAATSP
jgi:hypothetical protein